VNRTKSSWFLVAFIVIGILTIIEGVNDGWTLLNWLVLAVSIVFGAQSAYGLAKTGSSET
jgi:type IV secretory pathway VirB2 component (pilin)